PARRSDVAPLAEARPAGPRRVAIGHLGCRSRRLDGHAVPSGGGPHPPAPVRFPRQPRRHESLAELGRRRRAPCPPTHRILMIMSLTLPKYVLVTPARNEAAYIEKTIQAVVAQTVLPE